jgi:hypothetical protein
MFIALSHDPKRPKLEQRLGDIIDGAGVDEEEATAEAEYWIGYRVRPDRWTAPPMWDVHPATRQLVERVQDEGGAVAWRVVGRLADVAELKAAR